MTPAASTGIKKSDGETERAAASDRSALEAHPFLCNDSRSRNANDKMRRMRTGIKLLLGIGALVAPVAQAAAHGAVAAGGITNGSPYGSAYGVSYSYATKAEADARALKECEEHRGKIGSPCEIVADYSRQWASVAMDPKSDTPGFGWAVEADKKTAEARAMYRCQTTSPDDRKAFCAVAITHQDTKP